MKRPEFIFDFIKSKNNKSKGTILILPGFAANFGPWHNILGKLDEYDIYLLYCPGGLEINCQPIYEEMNEMLRFDFISNYIVDFIKEKHLKDVILMGNCIATAMATLVENKCREHISKLVLITPYCKTYMLSKDLVRKYLPVKSIELLVESGKVIFKKPLEFKNSAYMARYQEAVDSSLAKLTQLEFFMDQEIYNEDTFNYICHSYQQIKVPTLICISMYDPVLHYEEGYKELKALMPNAKFVIFDDSKHMLYEEEHEKFTKVLKEFLNHK